MLQMILQIHSNLVHFGIEMYYLSIEIPLVVRLSGTNVEKGQKILKDSGKKVITADTLSDAAHKVVSAWKQVNGSKN